MGQDRPEPQRTPEERRELDEPARLLGRPAGFLTLQEESLWLEQTRAIGELD